MKTSTELLVERLERIARANNDHFKYCIKISMLPKRIRYGFVCEETADDHTFIYGTGDTIEDASRVAENTIAESCQQWGYKNVE